MPNRYPFTFSRLALLIGSAFTLASGAVFADAANPNPDTTGVAVANPNGTVTVTLQGTWFWAGQNCTNRYGAAWAVDWWGVSLLPTPSPSFKLSHATTVSAWGETTRARSAPDGSLRISNGTFFHVGQFYAGEDVFTPATCSVAVVNNVSGATGAWQAAATYPSAAQIPPSICVNMYDLHGRAGQPGTPMDFSPVTDADNSIQTNAYVPDAPLTGTGIVGGGEKQSPYTIVGGGGYSFCLPQSAIQ